MELAYLEDFFLSFFFDFIVNKLMKDEMPNIFPSFCLHKIEASFKRQSILEEKLAIASTVYSCTFFNEINCVGSFHVTEDCLHHLHLLLHS